MLDLSFLQTEGNVNPDISSRLSSSPASASGSGLDHKLESPSSLAIYYLSQYLASLGTGVDAKPGLFISYPFAKTVWWVSDTDSPASRARLAIGGACVTHLKNADAEEDRNGPSYMGIKPSRLLDSLADGGCLPQQLLHPKGVAISLNVS
ncbi:unnamed protein product [Protopolystoma xenopodis]|uniref:Uncharacterized protein n=1 Tax=Protopolystoma xenopodis TaxID=117903 RepID=A0A3S5ADN7_9PLAT|nr:unnamed protein product [Protopolystoma xenopodis]